MTSWSVGYNPISDRCCQWETVLGGSGSQREDADVIFAATNELFDQNLLLNLTQAGNPTAFQSVCRFLSCDGIFFSRLVRLTVETQIQYDLPITKLPVSLSSILAGPNGNRLSWLWGRFNLPRGILSLSPLEYFLVQFCAQLLNFPSTNIWANSEAVGSLDCAYTSVLSELFEFFLRVDKGRNYGQVNGSFRNFFPVSPANTSSSSSSDQIVTPLNLFQKRVLNGSLLAEETLVEFSPNVSSLTQFQPLNGGNGDRWRSQLILSIAADIWLSVPTMSYREEMPKPLHLVVLRYAVKHLHKYVYTGPIPPEELHHRESLTQRLFSQPLLGLLSLSFKKWPLDSSFRYALELWLSFVQPWRYASADEGGEAENPKVIFHQWVKFLSGHLAFYTSLLASCCDRLARTDLTSSNSSFIAYRMIKVFALPGLVELLEQTERNCMAPSFTDLSFHMNEKSLSWNTTSRQDSFCPDTSLISLKSSAVQTSMAGLMRNIQAATKEVEWKLREKAAEEQLRSANQSWISWIFGGEDEDSVRVGTSVPELRKSLEFLQFSKAKMSEIFHISVETADTSDGEISDRISSVLPPFRGSPTKEPPERQLDVQTKTLRLSPNGRDQLLNNLRRFGPTEKGLIPDLLPVREDEISSLVKLAKWLSSEINERWSDQFDLLYYEDSIGGRICRRFLEPPTRVASFIRPILVKNPPVLPARVNLRCLAARRFLFTLVILSLLLSLVFKWNPIAVCFTLLFVHFIFRLIPNLWSEPDAEVFSAVCKMKQN